ncbi:MAG: sulfatase-like hydrolase/transferase [Myxococcota bacterium]
MPVPPNVVIAVLDDVGVDQVAPYGFPGAPPTPVIQALADDGLRFDQVWATPVCSPTRAAVMTGQVAHRNRVGAVIKAGSTAELTLPEMLDSSGTDWSAAAIGKWHLGTTHGASGVRHALLQGFDWFAGSMNNIAVPPTVEPATPRSYASWERVGFDGVVAVETTFSTVKIADDAIDALGRLTEPFLLYVAFHAAHRPLMQPPPELVGGTIAAEGDENLLYALNVTAADHELGRILDALGDRRDRTLVVVLGDNGTPRHAKDDDGQEGGKGSFTEGGLRVPFIASGPPVTARGATDALVSVTDLFPTLMELAGVPSVDQPLDGRSLVPVFADPAAPIHDRLYAELRHPAAPPWERIEQAARDVDLKVVRADDVNAVFRIDGFSETEVTRSDLSGQERRRVKKLDKDIAGHEP